MICSAINSDFYFCLPNLWSMMLSENRQQYKGIPTWLDHCHRTIVYLCKPKSNGTGTQTTNAVDWPRHRCKLLTSPPGHWHLFSDGSFLFIYSHSQLLDVHLAKTNSFSWSDVQHPLPNIPPVFFSHLGSPKWVLTISSAISWYNPSYEIVRDERGSGSGEILMRKYVSGASCADIPSYLWGISRMIFNNSLLSTALLLKQ